jgi:TldD protein
MNSTLVEHDVLERTLSEAMARGGEFAEVFVEDRTTSSAMLDQRRVEQLSSGRDRGAGIRVVVGDTTGFAHTADLTESGLVAAARAAAAVARDGGGGVREIALGPLRDHPSRATVPPGDVDKARKIELMNHADDAARSEGSSITQVQVALGDSTRHFIVANSDGLFAGDHQVRTRFNVSCIATGDTGMQTGYRPIAGTRGFELLSPDAVAEAARGAARQAITKLDARPAPSGDLPVVLAGGSGGILFHEACGHGLEADAILKQASVYAGKVGQLVASPLVTLVDDGTVEGEWGYLAIDDEGRPGARNVLIENGVLTDYMWDYLRSRKEGRVSSGNGRRQSYQHLPMVRMTNTYLLEGDSDADEIVAQTPYGVYVAQLGGGQVNTATGDFVFGMTAAFMIEDGKITSPLRDCNLIGNGPDVLQRVDAVATDFSMTPGTCGKNGQSVPVGTGQATMRLTGVTIGGAAA